MEYSRWQYIQWKQIASPAKLAKLISISIVKSIIDITKALEWSLIVIKIIVQEFISNGRLPRIVLEWLWQTVDDTTSFGTI